MSKVSSKDGQGLAHRWTTRSYGKFENLVLERVTIPLPGPDEVRVKVRAIGLNFADCFGVLGLYEAAGQPPYTPGFEVCGTVEHVGAQVTRFVVGDPVYALTRFGGYTTLLNVAATHVRRLKNGWSFAEGAALPAQAFTAWYALCVLGAMPHTAHGTARQLTSARRAVLVHSAAGGVGLNLVRMVQKIGGVPVCSVGHEDKAGVLKERCGVPRERVVVRGVDDKVDGFESVVRERALGGEGGLDVVVDAVMGAYFQPGYALLNPGGRYVVMGSASLMPGGDLNLLSLAGWRNLVVMGWNYLTRPKLDLVGSINQNKTVSAFNVGYLFSELELLDRGMDEVEEMDLPKPLIGKTFSFDNAPDALQYFQGGRSVGKVVLLVD